MHLQKLCTKIIRYFKDSYKHFVPNNKRLKHQQTFSMNAQIVHAKALTTQILMQGVFSLHSKIKYFVYNKKYYCLKLKQQEKGF